MIFDRDNWQEIFSTLKKNKWRSFMTAFGVFWGIFLLIVMLGSGRGLYNGAMIEFNRWATNSVAIWTQPTTVSHKGFPRGRKWYFNNEDIQALRQQIPEIEHIAPRNKLGGYRGLTNVVRGLKYGGFNIYGDYPEIINIQLIDLVAGRFLNVLDLKERRKVAAIGGQVKEVLFEPGENAVGEYIQIQGIPFKVIGIFESNGEGDQADEDLQTVFIPFTTFQAAFNYGDLVSWFSLTSRHGIAASIVENKSAALLAERHQIAPQDKPAIGRWNTEKEYRRLVDLFFGINALTWFVGSFTLIAGVIGVSNIMLVIVKERTREIGIRRAIGATPLAVVGQIVMESIILTTAAGYSGLVAGIFVLEAVTSVLKRTGAKAAMFRNPEVDLTVALIALGILVVCGAIAGLVPGIRALSLKPVEAIRTQ